MTTQSKKHRINTAGARWLILLGLIVVVAFVYRPRRNEAGEWGLLGVDFHQLHERRISFLKQQYQAHGTIPKWYSREFLGSPFTGNIQNFPLIPTRLLLLPLPTVSIYGAAIMLAAALSAGFTYAYCLRLGMHPLAAAAGGLTFAMAGFFVSRVCAGQITLLEAYPALPLLLWLIERLVDAPAGAMRRRMAVLAICCGMIALAGHPQLPVYALVFGGLYALLRLRSLLRWQALAAMVLGAALAAVALVPMMLLIPESTRSLPLDRAINDIVIPWKRLASMVFPMRDGVAIGEPGLPQFTGYPSPAYFWDCANYIGLLPLASVIMLAGMALWRRRITAPAVILTALSLLAFVLATPAGRPITAMLPDTVMRSPARLMYVVSFGLSVACGAALALILRIRTRAAVVVAMMFIAAHGYDLWRNPRLFLRPPFATIQLRPGFEQWVREQAGNYRVAIDYDMIVSLNRQIDDVGFFDSITLKRPYLELLRLERAPQTAQIQELPGTMLQASTLARFGVKYVLLPGRRPDLERVFPTPVLNAFEVPNPTPRAQWAQPAAGRTISYRRPTSDRIEIDASSTDGGEVQILEAFEPGWSATIDGNAAAVNVANGFAMAIAIPPGAHKIVLTYATRGRGTGAAISGAAAVGLVVLLVSMRSKREQPAAQLDA